MKKVLALILTVALVLSLVGCGGDTPPTEEPLTKEEMMENVETIYIGNLEEDFRNNVVAAKDKYVGKPFTVPGCVLEIKEDSCVLSYLLPTSPVPVGGARYYVKAKMPVDELKHFNTGDLIRVVGSITGDIETTVEGAVNGTTSTCNYITMENAYFVDKITELSGTVHVSSGPVIFRYIEVPFLRGDLDRIKLIPYLSSSSWLDPLAFEETVTEGAKVTISVSDITFDRGYEVSCTPSNIKVEKAGQ